MKTIGRFISTKELSKYNEKFNSKTYMDLVKKLNLPQENINYDIVELTHTPDDPEENIVVETNKLIDFGDKAKAVLSHYQTKRGNDLVYEGEVFQVWKREGKHVIFKEYINGELVDEKVEDEFIDIYEDYLGVDKDTPSLFYNPASCIQSVHVVILKVNVMNISVNIVEFMKVQVVELQLMLLIVVVELTILK